MDHLPLFQRAPGALVARRRGCPVTAARFLAHALELAHRLPAGRFAVNLCRDRYHFSVAFAAVVVAGKTNLLPSNRLPATVAVLTARFPDAFAIDDSREERSESLPVVDPCAALIDRDHKATIPEIAADHLAAVVFTSASTGRAKAIRKPWRTFVASTRINARELGVDAAAVELAATVPAQHMYGLETSVLMPLFAPVTVSSEHPLYPRQIEQALARLQAPRVLVSTPFHLRILLESGAFVSSLERIWSATAPLDPALARELEAATGATVTEIFGTSETGSLARREPAREEAWTPFAGFQLRHHEGRTTAVADHLPEPVELQDLLELEPDGRFRLRGRHEDQIKIAGKRASLAELNLRLQRLPGVRDGVIFEPPEQHAGRSVQRLAALVVAPDLTACDIRERLARRIDAAFLPRPILMVERLPRLESGKLPRESLLRLFREHMERNDAETA